MYSSSRTDKNMECYGRTAHAAAVRASGSLCFAFTQFVQSGKTKRRGSTQSKLAKSATNHTGPIAT